MGHMLHTTMCFYIARNLESVLGLEQVVTDKLAKERREGRTVTPFPVISLQNLRISLL